MQRDEDSGAHLHLSMLIHEQLLHHCVTVPFEASVCLFPTCTFSEGSLCLINVRPDPGNGPNKSLLQNVCVGLLFNLFKASASRI